MAIETVIPLGDRILVKREDAESKTPGGIVIPDMAKKDSTFGQAIAVGPGAWLEDGERRRPVAVKVGQRVLFGKYAGTEIEVNGQKFTMIREDDVLGVVE